MMPVAREYEGCRQVQTRIPIRRLGRDIPKGTPCTLSRKYLQGGHVEVYVRTEYGGFVVTPSEIEAAA